MISQNTLSEQLKNLGLRPANIVMVHASLRKVGEVEGRANGLIESILSVIGEAGTMLMILGSRANDIFNASETIADPEMGMLAEVFRQFPGTIVSDHAASRFCAIGKEAEELIRNPPLHDYYGEGSVLQRITKKNGKILRLGANIDTVTLTHHAEYLAKVHPKRRVKRRYIREDIGEQWIESLDDCHGIQDWPHGDYFGQILVDFLKQENVQKGKVGNCMAELFLAKDFIPFAVSWMESHLEK